MTKKSDANGRFARGLEWKATNYAGVRYKSLRYDRDTGAGTVLIEMGPGTTYGRHRHTAGEDVLVLEGEMIVGTEVTRAGEHLYSPPGSVHEPRTDVGCLIFATFPGRIEHL